MFKIYDGGESFFQWDHEQRLIVSDPTVNEVHFCNKTDDCALTCEVYELGALRVVDVPNILLQDSWTIRVYAYCTNHTKHLETFKVIARSKPADYVYTETEIKTWGTLEQRMAYLEENGVPKETIEQSIEEYLAEHPIEAGATAEQVAQIEKNAADIKELQEKEVDLSDYALKSEIPDVSNFITEIPGEYVTETELAGKGYLTEHQSLEGYATDDDVATAVSDKITMKDLTTATANFVTEEQMNTAISNAMSELVDGDEVSY